MMMRHCMICLEPGGTERPPCGFLHDGVAFHKGCLERFADTGNTQCPHCGVCIPGTALKRLNRTLKGWLKMRDRPWNRRPFFIRVQSGMMYGARETQVLCSAIGIVVSCLMLMARGGDKEEGVVFVGQMATSYRFWLYQGVHMVQVVLKRVAVLASGGRIECDGYEISASRKRRKQEACCC